MTLTPEQLAARQCGIGGSDAGAVVGLSPFKSTLQCYYEKRGEAPLSEEETEAMEWGTLLEEPIAQKFSRVTGLKVRKQPLKIATGNRFMLASIDRQILGETAILECKALNAFTRIESASDLPDYMYLQAMHYLEVYGYDKMYFAILIGGQKFVQFPVKRDQATIDMLVAAEAEFWRRVELGDPPSVDGSDATKELARRLWPHDSGRIISLDSDDARATVHALLRAKDALKSAEDKKTAAENWLKFRMEDASTCKIPGVGEITWKYTRTHKDEVCDLGKLKADYPEIYAACVTMQEKGGGRRFLVKPEKGIVTT